MRPVDHGRPQQRQPTAGSGGRSRHPTAAITVSGDGLAHGADGVTRCAWGDSTPDYRSYHDDEWGLPVADDVRLFEKLSLEGFQAGLSWLTILRKREAFRAAFAGFDPQRIARFGERDIVRLLGDAGIVRHRGKIEAVVNNAARALEVIEAEGSLASYLWRFEPRQTDGPHDIEAVRQRELPPEAQALARDLKRRGWKFVGPTTVYAFMQAMGLVNDHRPACDTHAAVARARTKFKPPKA
jgi:DNA-3-methyladenine glycosylase I